MSGIRPARDEGKSHEDCCQDNARFGENDLDVVIVNEAGEKIAVERFLAREKERTEPALPPKNENVDEATDHRRDPQRQIDQRDEQRASAKGKSRHRPGSEEAEDRVQRDDNRRGQERQLDGVSGRTVLKRF